MGNQIIQSIKTIAQSLVDNAGYDKTRGGLIVGVNPVTNTYSVKVDGVTYPIVRTTDDATYNIGDVVKVVIPCNQATQMYISSSILSDNSLGNKIANATTLAEDAKQLGLDNQVEIKDVSDIANSKNKTFRQDTAPTEGMSSGDIWVDTSDNNTLYVYDGTQWVFSGGGSGQDGLNNATILLYQRGATAPDKPTDEVEYTFADASLSPTSALNGWKQAIPEIDGNPCWVIAATASATTATDTIGVSEWSTQIKFVEDGATGATGVTGSTGLNQATIFLYSRTTSTKPSSPTTYTFSTGMLSPLPSDWSRSVPANDGNPCYVTTAIAIGYGSDVTITSDAWSTPTVLVENGADGYSPTVTTGTASDGSTTITVTNKDGSSTTELVDGTARKDAADAAKVATNFINYDSTNGLVLGNKKSGSWVGYRTQIDNDSFNVLDENGDIIASYGSNEVELGKGNPNAIIKMCDGKAYVKNYIVGSQNTSVFCGQDVTVVGEWEGASEAYALFKQGFINIGQASSHIKFSNENGNMNQVEIQGQNITINGELAFGTEADAAVAMVNLGVADYVVEQGTSGDWRYRKWNSGIAECFGYMSLGSISVSAVGNVYRGTATVLLPGGVFNDIPSNVHITNGDPLVHIISINGRALDANTVLAYVWKATSSTVTVYGAFHIVGTWK